MNTRSLNIILLAVCLGLLGTLAFTIYLLWTRERVLPKVEPLIVSNIITQKQIAVRKVGTSNLLATLASYRPLRWAAIEDTNYVRYMAKLRAIGCPEETIEDIILTDVAKLYAPRRRALLQRQYYEYWKSDSWEGGGDPEVRRELKELEEEQGELVRELLGVDFRTALSRYWGGGTEEEEERRLGFLAEEKRSEVLLLNERFDQALEEIYRESRGILLPEDLKRLQELQLERDLELGALLTPAEMEGYQLRNSPTADRLRSELTDFDISEADFKSLYRVKKVFEDQFERAFDPGDPAAQAVKKRAEAAAREALGEEMEKVLGKERYEEYVRAQDEDYQQLLRLSDRLSLPKQTVVRVYDMKVAAQQQKERLEENAQLSDEQRQRALAAIASEVETSVANAMGLDTFRAYRDSAGVWINELTQSEVLPAAERETQPPPLPPVPPVP